MDASDKQCLPGVCLSVWDLVPFKMILWFYLGPAFWADTFFSFWTVLQPPSFYGLISFALVEGTVSLCPFLLWWLWSHKALTISSWILIFQDYLNFACLTIPLMKAFSVFSVTDACIQKLASPSTFPLKAGNKGCSKYSRYFIQVMNLYRHNYILYFCSLFLF